MPPSSFFDNNTSVTRRHAIIRTPARRIILHTLADADASALRYAAFSPITPLATTPIFTMLLPCRLSAATIFTLFDAHATPVFAFRLFHCYRYRYAACRHAAADIAAITLSPCLPPLPPALR